VALQRELPSAAILAFVFQRPGLAAVDGHGLHLRPVRTIRLLKPSAISQAERAAYESSGRAAELTAWVTVGSGSGDFTDSLGPGGTWTATKTS
jgi:hypothetical protein